MALVVLTLQRSFVADHYHDFPGFREARHGHNWEIQASVRLGASSDSARFERALDAWIRGTDYTLLNELPALEGRNPTAETLAEAAFRHLAGAGLDPTWVKLREKRHTWALCRRAEA